MTSHRNPTVKKAAGHDQPFAHHQLVRSLRRAGAAPAIAHQIADQITERITPNMSTRIIRRLAFQLLRKQSQATASRYQLKAALMALGPSGFPFERYIAALFTWKGFDTQIGQLIHGKCVTHEVDVVATLNHRKALVECKYHNHPGIISTIKIPLYIYARFLDLQTGPEIPPFTEAWVATNTRFSEDARRYGRCMGLHLLDWDAPNGPSLRDWINDSDIYPITILNGISAAEKARLLNLGIITCQDLLSATNGANRCQITPQKWARLTTECSNLISGVDKVPL